MAISSKFTNWIYFSSTAVWVFPQMFIIVQLTTFSLPKEDDTTKLQAELRVLIDKPNDLPLSSVEK